MQEIGFIKAIYRYPVKSMAGERLAEAALGWHGIEGDRRFAFMRTKETGGFPWLIGSRFPGLLRYQPISQNAAEPTHIVTPDENILELRSEVLREEISAAYKSPVALFQLNHGIFDEAMISLINVATIDEIGRMSGSDLDPRRFRPNILLETNGTTAAAFEEDKWVGKIIAFGKENDGPSMSVMQRDARCAMINFDPDTAVSTPQILKTVVRSNQNNAGIYGSTLRSGLISEGDPVFLIEV
ncbi:MAG: MOSC N-terminal beta barrel domain-containing protein [Actinomycetota bacterium]